MRVNLETRSMDVRDYQVLTKQMLKWLNENHIFTIVESNGWHGHPTSIEFANPEDATLFKLRFDV